MSHMVIAVWFNLDGPPRFFDVENAKGKVGWQVTQHNGVDLLMIRTREGSHVRHAIPLCNVLYWTVDSAPRGNDVDQSKTRDEKHLYCVTCSANILVNGIDFGIHKNHDIQRFCCSTSVYNHHSPTCPNHRRPDKENHGDHSSESGRVTYNQPVQRAGRVTYYDRPPGNSVHS